MMDYLFISKLRYKCVGQRGWYFQFEFCFNKSSFICKKSSRSYFCLFQKIDFQRDHRSQKRKMSMHLTKASQPTNLQLGSEGSQFREETLALLREQSNKLKNLNAELRSKQEELALKQDQIRFLKETVVELQGENGAVFKQKEEMKNKLGKIMDEIQVYNETVVRPICVERERLRVELKEANEQESKYVAEIKRLNQQFEKQQSQSSSLQKQLNAAIEELKSSQIKVFQLEQSLGKEQMQTLKLTEEVALLSKSLAEETTSKEHINVELSTVNRQLTAVIDKYNRTVKDYEQRIKDIQGNMVQTSQLTKIQQSLKARQKQIEQLKSSELKATQRSEQARRKLLAQKEKLSKQLAKGRLSYSEIVSDLSNLKKSIRLERKVIEFESEESELFYQLYAEYERVVSQRDQMRVVVEEAKQQEKRAALEREKLAHQLDERQIEHTLLKTHFEEHLERLESQYEGRLITLNLKIRQQEQAFERLKSNQIHKQGQVQTLEKQLSSITQQFTEYKTTAQHSLQKLSDENLKLSQQMQQLYVICDENLNNKQNVDKMKRLMHSMLIGVNFMYHKYVGLRDKQRRLYMPIVEGFLKMRKEIVNNEGKKQAMEIQKQQQFQFAALKKNIIPQNKPKYLSRVRKSVYAVIATIRIGKLLQKNRSQKANMHAQGLGLIMVKGLQTRNKIPNMAELLQKQSEVLEKTQQEEKIITELLKVTNRAFSWPESKVSTLRIDVTRYVQLLQKTAFQKLSQKQAVNQQ